MPPHLLPPPLPDVRGELVRGGVGVLDHGPLLKQGPPLDGLQLVPRDGILVSVVSTVSNLSTYLFDYGHLQPNIT